MKKRIFKKNQIVITALAILIAVAGYINYADSTLKKDGKTESTAVEGEALASENNILEDIESLDQDITDETAAAGQDGNTGDEVISEEGTEDPAAESGESAEGTEPQGTGTEGEETGETASDTPGEAILTTASTYMAQARIEREQTRSQNKEMLLEIINNANLSEEERQSAVQSMVELTDAVEKEAAAEMLLEAKGFENVVVNMSGDTVDVVVPSTDLADDQRAQIEDIIKRKTGVSVENIVITPMGGEK